MTTPPKERECSPNPMVRLLRFWQGSGVVNCAIKSIIKGANVETRVQQGQRQEDPVTGAIEHQTSRAPSSLFLGLALGSMAVSAFLKFSGKNHWALFVGQWAAPFLIMGSYNKMVKQHGSDATTQLEAA
jgi:hypothetical protein